MKRSKFATAITAAVGAAFALGACAPGAASTVVVTAPPVVVTAPPVVITATPGATTAPAATALPAGSITLNGAGATFPDPIYTEWRFAFQYVDPSVVINYQANGSG